MESPTSCVSTASSSGGSFAYITWNPLLELLLHEHIGSILLLCVDDFELAKFALSCHFALDLLCHKEGTVLYDALSGTIACGSVSVTVWHHL